MKLLEEYNKFVEHNILNDIKNRINIVDFKNYIKDENWEDDDIYNAFIPY